LGPPQTHIDYPQKMPFYVYGSADELHIDHILARAPNAQMTAQEVRLELEEGHHSALVSALEEDGSVVAIADGYPESLLQPFSSTRSPAFFKSGFHFSVSIYRDSNPARSKCTPSFEELGSPIIRGTITLGANVYVDSKMINTDTPLGPAHVPPREERSQTYDSDRSMPHDHPLFRGLGPSFKPSVSIGIPHSSSVPILGPDPRQRNAWREQWDVKLALRNMYGKSPISEAQQETLIVESPKEYIPSPAIKRSSKAYFFP
jgi:hypothetical protein